MEDIQGEIVQVLVHTVKEKDVSANFPCHGMVTASFRTGLSPLIVEQRRGKRTWKSTASKL